MAKTTRSTKNSMTFLITFVLFLFLFGGVMVWGLYEFWQQTTAAEETPSVPQNNAPAAGYTPADTRRLLLITEDNGAAQGFVVLTAEPAAARMQALAIPRETSVTVGTEQTRLFELYETAGTAAVKEQVASLLGDEIHNVAVVSYDGIQKMVTHFGDGVIFTLTEAVSYQNADGATVTMKSGARTLSAVQVTDLLRYTGWHGGRRARADVQAELTAAIVNQYLTFSRFDEEDTDFKALMGIWRSDILASQFAQSRDALLFLARRNQNDICESTSLAGEFVGTGDAMRFEPAAPET